MRDDTICDQRWRLVKNGADLVENWQSRLSDLRSVVVDVLICMCVVAALSN